MKQHQIADDLQGIYDRWLDDIQLDILLTKRCNLNCIHCFLDERNSEMGMDTIRKIANDDLFLLHSQIKKRVINFSGGEVLMRKDIGKIFSMFRNLNVSAGCVSNGFFLTDEIIDILKENHIAISLSLDGVGEVHNFYRRNRDAFERLDKAIDKLVNRQVPFSVICSVSKINQEHIGEIIEWCIKKKVRSIRFQVVTPEGNAKSLQDKGLLLDDSEKQALFESLLFYSGRYVSDIKITGYGTFKSELREHGCKFGLRWGKTCHSNSTPWPKSFGIDTNGDIIQMHPYHNNVFWKIGHIDEGLYNVICRYYASEKHIMLLNTLCDTYEEILKAPEECIFEDLYLERKVAERLLQMRRGG